MCVCVKVCMVRYVKLTLDSVGPVRPVQTRSGLMLHDRVRDWVCGWLSRRWGVGVCVCVLDGCWWRWGGWVGGLKGSSPLDGVGWDT